jgi:hypothetical protein
MLSEKKVVWKAGSTYNPFKITEARDGFTISRDADKPVVCQLAGGEKGTYFPSGRYVKHFTSE